ncbi:hypothetical protein [Paenibacillus sp. SN-8-1]|uniref:hypothetical protein n=1 Tax=Paenibacillus sp. SN-8-1 TaxID=3435409 RepID=UPI003D9A5732
MHPYFIEKRYESEQQRLERINRTEWMMHRRREPRRNWLAFFTGLRKNQTSRTNIPHRNPDMGNRPSP